MPKISYTAVSLACFAAMAFAAGSAQAAPCSGVSVGTSSTSDVTLAGAASDQCVVSLVNPQQGPGGNDSGFSGAFGGGWSLLGKVDATGSASLDDVGFSWTFSKGPDKKSGTWTLTTDQDASFDLVFAMHASNRSNAFLFDDVVTEADELNGGGWAIHWLNNGGQVPGFSNLALFVREIEIIVPPDQRGSADSVVPEPATYALVLAGLGAIGFTARRRKD